jgi:hypothetical protein
MTDEQKRVVTDNINRVMTKMYCDFMAFNQGARLISDNHNAPKECYAILDFSAESFKQCYQRAMRSKLDLMK